MPLQCLGHTALGGIMSNQFLALLKCRRGATAIEYGLICALIVIAMVGGLTALGGGLNGLWANVSAAVTAN